MRGWELESVGAPIRCVDLPDPELRPGGAVLEVLSAHVPAYTGAVISGSRGYVFPTPLVIGPACIGRVRAAAQDVFNVEVRDIVLNSSFLSSSDVDRTPDDILVGWTGIGFGGVASERSRRMQEVWHDGVFAEKALCPQESLTRLTGVDGNADYGRLSFLTWLSIAAEGVDRAEVSPGQTVIVSGASGQLGAPTPSSTRSARYPPPTRRSRASKR